MADEQTQHSDLIDDAIRQAERQLEQKLEALRMSALGDSASTVAPEMPLEGGEPAQLQPTGAIPAGVPETMHVPEPTATWPDPSPAYPEPDGEWSGEADGDEWGEPAPVVPIVAAAAPATDDAVIRPVEDIAAGAAAWEGTGFVPDDAQPGGYVDDEPESAWEPPVVAPEPTYEPAPEPAYEPAYEPEPAPLDAYDPGTPSQGTTGGWGPAPASPYEPVTVMPSEEEVQFWAQTRTALRMLQQATDTVPQQVTSQVTGQVEAIVRDELTAPNATLRQIQQQLPQVAERVERSVGEEVPAQLDRMERGLRDAMHQDISHAEHAITDSVSTTGQTVVENVDRVGRSVTENVGRAERTVAEQIDRVEQGMRAQLERIETSLRSDLGRVEDSVREEIEPPALMLRQMQEEVPAQFQRLERTVRETDPAATLERITRSLTELRDFQKDVSTSITTTIRDDLASTRRGVRDLVEMDLGGVLGDLVNASRLTLDKLGNYGSDLDRDRLQRVEDLEMLVDSMSTGWKGLYGAVTKLFDRVDTFDTRMAGVERQLEAIGELEQTVDQALGSVKRQLDTHLGAMQQHLQELQPAPVIVTVNHPDAQIAHNTRAGFVGGQEPTT